MHQTPLREPPRPPHITGGLPASNHNGIITSGQLLVALGPIIVLLVATVLLAMTAWMLGWHREEMFLVGAGMSSVVIVLAVILLYRQVAARQKASTAQHSAEAQVKAIVDSAMDAIISVDDTQRVVTFNRAAEAMFGWPKEEAIGAPLTRFIPERFRSAHMVHVRRFGDTGVTSRRMGAERIVTGLRRSGEEFPIDASISQHAEASGKVYTVILRDVTERVRADQALRESKEELQELASAAHEAREQEKSRMARELHDALAQVLTALKMDVAWARERLQPGDAAVASRLDRMQSALDRAVKATRRIAADLRPLMLDDLGLFPAVEWLTEDFTQRTGVTCELSLEAPELELDGPHATAVFRIVQESLANVAKHARASQVEVAIRRNGSAVTVTVRDDGVGFSPQDPRKPDSYGLLGLRERALLLAGRTSVTSAPGEGTTVEVLLPIAPGMPHP